MIRIFIKENTKAIGTGFKWMSLIFTSLVLIIFLVGLINNQKPDLLLFIVVVFSAGIGFPIFGIIVGFMRWWWDYSVTRRNFNSFPFSHLNSLSFKKVVKNKDSKTKFISEYYSGKVDRFIVDCDVETQNESNQIRFKFFINPRPLSNANLNRIENDFKAQNGYFDFNWISKKYHYKNHQLRSVSELEKELIDFGNLILNENIEPSEYPKR